MAKVNAIIDDVLRREGGAKYTNLPGDSGGPTKYGITLNTLSKWRKKPCVAEDVQALAEAEARHIYTARYWYEPGFDQVAPVSAEVAEELMDTGVNMGPVRAIEFLQRLLNAFNNRAKFYPDLVVDGVLGPNTLVALSAYLARRGKEGELVLLFSLDSVQTERYVGIAERREKDEEFVYGQILQRAAKRWIA
jgi:lysozyme family protein